MTVSKNGPLSIIEGSAKKNVPKKRSAERELKKASKLSVEATMPMRKWKVGVQVPGEQ